jgi:hypothetical protein
MVPIFILLLTLLYRQKRKEKRISRKLIPRERPPVVKMQRETIREVRLRRSHGPR